VGHAVWDRHKVTALVFFIPPNKNEKAAVGGDDIAGPESWVVHDAVRRFGFQRDAGGG
jgi:hypothetical protein